MSVASGAATWQLAQGVIAVEERTAIKNQMQPLLEWGSTGKRQRQVHALAKNLLKLRPALWTFADIPDVEPTNNAAERGLRAAVIYRKLSLGSRSQGGERIIERLLLGRPNLPAPAPLAVRLPQRGPHRQNSRRSRRHPHLTAPG